MKLIRELCEDNISLLVERNEETQSNTYFIEGIFMQAEKCNRNGRVYPKPIMESEVNRYVVEYVNKKRALGELSHPTTPKINEADVSHLITELQFQGNNVIGKAKVLDTPKGKIVKEFLKEGIMIGVSSRGVGSVKKNSSGINEVQNDFRLATIDIVSDPSGPDCFVSGIMENVDWVYDEAMGWKALQYAEQIKESVKSNSIVLDDISKMEIFKNFMLKLNK
jgi:hypothetical protein